jgi:hypothetical protein
MTDSDIDEVVRDLVEWMDGWEIRNYESEFVEDEVVTETSVLNESTHSKVFGIDTLKQSLDLIREIEDAVLEDNELSYGDYMDRRYKMVYPEGSSNFESPGETYAVDRQGPKPRLRALHRTLREVGEI